MKSRDVKVEWIQFEGVTCDSGSRRGGGKDLMLSRVIVEIEVEGGTDLMLSSLSGFSWSDWSGVCVEPESVGVL